VPGCVKGLFDVQEYRIRRHIVIEIQRNVILTTTGLRYIGSARTTQKKHFYCLALGMARITLKTNHAIDISPVHWCAYCCLATSHIYSSYCCVSISRGVYRAVAWQCVDVSQYPNVDSVSISGPYVKFHVTDIFFGGINFILIISRISLHVLRSVLSSCSFR
jgi:hypothetical protein